jgi:hypothetical protein
MQTRECLPVRGGQIPGLDDWVIVDSVIREQVFEGHETHFEVWLKPKE